MSGYVAVPPKRATLTAIGGGVEVLMPARRNVLVVAFLIVWLCGWATGELAALGVLLGHAPPPTRNGDPRAFMGLWLLAWTCGGAFALSGLLWMLVGRERLRIGSDEVLLRRELLGIGWSRRYDPREVRNLRAVEIVPGPFGMQSRSPFGFGTGPLAFDYGARTVRFGAGLDSAEALPLARTIIAAQPRLRPPADSEP